MGFISMSSLALRWAFRLVWLGLLFSSCFLVLVTLAYFSFRTDIGFLLAKQAFVRDSIWMSVFYLHISSSILCLFTGPFQFISFFRKKTTQGWHRVLGKVYIFSILFLAAPTGAYMAVFANGGFGTQLGFIILSVLWFVSTYIAWQAILEKDILLHKKWMIRSFALTFSAVTLRIWMPVLSAYCGMNPDLVLLLTAWINWLPNLLVAELLLIFFPKYL